MPENMPDRMPEGMPGRMPKDMPGRMPDRMPEDMSDRMPEDLPVRKCKNAMVGIIRSEVIFRKKWEPLEKMLVRRLMTICLSVFLENLGSGVKSRKLNMFKNVQNIFRSCDCSGKRNECTNQPPALCSQ